jgi:sugar-specific transcriptional regulator TrmB
MLHTILRTFDLSEKEIKIFTKVLELGAQPASHIARVTELPRNTVRSILDNLIKTGLMVKTNRANTQYYAVEKKENIIRALKHEKIRVEEKITNQIDLIENYGDELAAHQSKSRPKITFYEGKNGIEKVYEDTLTAKDGIVSWASFEGMHGALPDYFKTYYDRRTKKKIFIRSIHPDTDLARERQKKDSKEMRDSALVPSEKYNWVPEIQIYNDKINISSWKEKLGIIIESPEISQALKAAFELSWETAKTLDKKKKK